MSHRTFSCFGARCGVWTTGEAADGAVADARDRLLSWHTRFTRFDPTSELSRLNADPRHVVPASTTMTRLIDAVREAAHATGGLVDGTLLGEIEAAGYVRDSAAPLPLELALRLAPARRPAAPNPHSRWGDVSVDGWEVSRPPGVGFDGGGLAKGLFADLIAEDLRGRPSFAVNCGGDLRFAGPRRRLEVADPFGGAPLHTFELDAAAVATSGIGRRSWLGPDGRPAQHLLDPATGRPAFTGVIQATALAPTAAEAEWRAKAAVLSGPAGADAWLEHGGVVVLDDGTHRVTHPPGPRRSEENENPMTKRGFRRARRDHRQAASRDAEEPAATRPAEPNRRSTHRARRESGEGARPGRVEGCGGAREAPPPGRPTGRGHRPGPARRHTFQHHDVIDPVPDSRRRRPAGAGARVSRRVRLRA